MILSQKPRLRFCRMASASRGANDVGRPTQLLGARHGARTSVSVTIRSFTTMNPIGLLEPVQEVGNHVKGTMFGCPLDMLAESLLFLRRSGVPPATKNEWDSGLLGAFVG
jgi:hypothetical protein